MVRYSLGHHGLPGTGRSPHQDASRRVDSDCAIPEPREQDAVNHDPARTSGGGLQIEMRQRKLDRFANLLLLDVEAADIGIGDVRFLCERRISRRLAGLGRMVPGPVMASVLIVESASGGRMSTSEFECRWRATLELGFRTSRSIVLSSGTMV